MKWLKMFSSRRVNNANSKNSTNQLLSTDDAAKSTSVNLAFDIMKGLIAAQLVGQPAIE
jgi:hypothetical protein